jgi:phage repressor protein C with HTH and peptisase S24 domain
MSPPAFGISPSNRAYGLIMPDDSMAPLYEPGDTVIADPQRGIAPGKSIVVWFKGEERAPLIRRLRDRAPGGLILETVAEPHSQFIVPLDEIEEVHGVAGVYRAEIAPSDEGTPSSPPG